MKIIKLKNTIYPVNIYIILTNDWEEVNIKFNTRLTNSYDAVTFNIEGNIYVGFLLQEFKLKYIVHEVIHVVNRIFKRSSVKLNIKNDETQAYLTSWLFEEINKIIVKNI